MNVNKSQVMKRTSMSGGRRMNVALNGGLLKEVDCFQFLGSKVIMDGGIDIKVKTID